MKVVIDTNVLVSAALKDKDPEAVILYVVEQPDFAWVVSPEILAEYKEVLSRPKFALPEPVQRKWFELLDAVPSTLIAGPHPHQPGHREQRRGDRHLAARVA